MNMRKTVKKIAALVAGTTMLGATIMGATALTLADYPSPFVTNGIWDGKIVVGAKAATSDVVGAIDLAASLQAEATTTSEVNVPGAAGTATVIGDSAEFKTGSDVLRLGETIGTVKATFTENDLDALKSGVFDTGGSSTPVKQYLKFDNTSAYVDYMENSETDAVADFLYFPDDSYLFEYHMEFTEGAVADIEGTGGVDLNDFESEVLTMLGAPFTITSATRTSNTITLTLLGGEVADTLRDGETKTYTIDGKDYEVTAVFISSDDSSAKLSVNGMLTKELNEGDTDVLSSDVTIGVQEILTNQREGLVEFYLGANKLELTDTDYTDSTYSVQTVKVGGNSVDNPYLIIKATNQSSNTEVKLNYIKYKVLNDEEIFVPAGKGLKEFLTDDANVMLTDTWDVKYTGMMKTGESIIKLNAKSDYGYEFEFENVNGVKYSFPFVTNKDGAYKWGDDDDDFIFIESNDGNQSADNLTANKNTFVSDDDYFAVSDRSTAAMVEDKAVTSIMRYQSLSTGESTVTFRNLAGDTITVSYSGTLGSSATGELIVDGATHDFYIGADSATASEKYALSIDLDGDSGFGTDEVRAVAKGGAVIDFGSQTFDATGPVALAAAVDVNITTPASQFDESADGPVFIDVRVNESGTDQMSLSVITPSLLDDPDDDDWAREYTTYGAFVERYAPSTGTAIPEATIHYPSAMRGAQVFVTAGTVEVQEGSTTAGGAITTTTVNPIAVGLAVLDTDAPALGSDNLIVVGGPCVNTVAAALMGNPAVCTEGFTPGKAVIKLFADKNALLVAGYSAQDTLGACYVLSDYAKYDLTGTEVEVVVADLNTISVNKVV